jgi:hypothetical protein
MKLERGFIACAVITRGFRSQNNLFPDIDIALSAFNESDKPILKYQSVFKPTSPYLS